MCDMCSLTGPHTQKDSAAAAAKSLQSCPTLRPHRRQPTRLRRPWDSPGKNTAVGCHCLLPEGLNLQFNDQLSLFNFLIPFEQTYPHFCLTLEPTSYRVSSRWNFFSGDYSIHLPNSSNCTLKNRKTFILDWDMI